MNTVLIYGYINTNHKIYNKIKIKILKNQIKKITKYHHKDINLNFDVFYLFLISFISLFILFHIIINNSFIHSFIYLSFFGLFIYIHRINYFIFYKIYLSLFILFLFLLFVYIVA